MWALRCDNRLYAETQYSQFFLHEQFVEQGLLKESLYLQRTKLLQQVVKYIRDDTTHYRGPSPTLKDPRGLFTQTSNPLLVGILDKHAVW